MGFLKKIFNKREKAIEEKEVFSPVDIDCKWECFACKDGVDPTIHKYIKQNGNYFHKVCWKKALKLAHQKNII